MGGHQRGERTTIYRNVMSEDRSSMPDDLVAEPVAGAVVVELQSPRLKEVTTYLVDATVERYAVKWEPVIAHLHRDPHGPLAVALSTPLMVFLARVAYSETRANPSALLDEALTEPLHVEEHLLNRLVPARYSNLSDRQRPQRWRAEIVSGWLRFLAAHLRRLDTPDLVWWRLDRALLRPVVALNIIGALCIA